MTYTPGPWVVFAADADGPNDVLPAMRPGCIASGIDSSDDARLIAAAPFMLAALQRILETSSERSVAVLAAAAIERATPRELAKES